MQSLITNSWSYYSVLRDASCVSRVINSLYMRLLVTFDSLKNTRMVVTSWYRILVRKYGVYTTVCSDTFNLIPMLLACRFLSERKDFKYFWKTDFWKFHLVTLFPRKSKVLSACFARNLALTNTRFLARFTHFQWPLLSDIVCTDLLQFIKYNLANYCLISW